MSTIFERRSGLAWRPRHARSVLAAAVGVLLAGAGAASAATIKRFEATTALSIAAGADGNLWFDTGEGTIGRMTPSGTVTEFSDGIAPGEESLLVAAGPDGNIWFTEFDANRVARITPAGQVTQFRAGLRPIDIAAGPDGNLWFTQPSKGVGRITPTGTVTQFSAGITLGGLAGITAGPDGNVWFGVLTYPPRVARITPAGAVTEFSAGLGRARSLESLTAGPDGNVWFTTSDAVGRITPAGKITLFSKGLSPGADPDGIAAGPDGNLWFTEFEAGRLGRITPAGKITEFSAGLPSGDLLSGITAGPAASLWFMALGGIGQLTPTPGTEVSVLTRAARVNARGTTTAKVSCGTGTEPCAGRLELTVTTGKALSEETMLASGRFALKPGQRSTVKLTLNASGRRRLARSRKGRVVTRYRASSSAGDARGRLTLTRARRR